MSGPARDLNDCTSMLVFVFLWTKAQDASRASSVLGNDIYVTPSCFDSVHVGS